MTSEKAAEGMSGQDNVLVCDVLVIGSGAGGLATAVTAAHHGLKVILAEKDNQLGGTTAWSGGWLWIPRNPLALEAGIVEDEDAPLQYLRSETGNRANDPRVSAFLANGPEMVSFFRDHTEMEWLPGNSIPDFHETPGSAKGGRSVTAAPYDGRKLGNWIEKLKPPLDIVSLAGMGIASGSDLGHFFNARRNPKSALHVFRRLARHGLDLLMHRRGMHLVNGNALVARLLRSAIDLDVTILPGHPAERILRTYERVTGAICGGVEIHARRGVVLATGGFPHDSKRHGEMFEHVNEESSHHSAASASNTGDGLRLGESAGGTVSQDFFHAGAWSPVSLVPRKDGTTGNFPHLVERAKPGFIAVGPDGRRFVNEADSYHDFMSALFAAYPGATSPHAWLIADHAAQRRFGLGWAKPFPFPLGPYRACGYLKSGDSPQALARETGLPAETLAETIARFNFHAERGEDPDFMRGRSAYNRIQGDPGNQPNPSLRPLEEGPFHAVRIVPGSLGTFAGLQTDECARVLEGNGKPIAGLFAAGNDMTSIFGGNYPAGGITLGPAMTFGYIAARVLAELPVTGVTACCVPQKATDEETMNDAVL